MLELKRFSFQFLVFSVVVPKQTAVKTAQRKFTLKPRCCCCSPTYVFDTNYTLVQSRTSEIASAISTIWLILLLPLFIRLFVFCASGGGAMR